MTDERGRKGILADDYGKGLLRITVTHASKGFGFNVPDYAHYDVRPGLETYEWQSNGVEEMLQIYINSGVIIQKARRVQDDD